MAETPHSLNSSLTPAVSSAIRILDAISASARPPTFSELQLALDLPKSSLSRLLQTLMGVQLVEVQQGRYQIGTRVLDYYASYSRRLDVIAVFQRVADEIGERIDETMQLAQLQGTEAVFLARRDCRRLIRPAAFPGRRVPAHATAVGKVLLAHLSATEFGVLYPDEALPALTPSTITSRKELLNALQTVRQDGYAQTRQESTLNLCCFSSPIYEASGRVSFALSICLATEDPSPERREAATRSVLLGAQSISHALGYRDPDYSL